MVSLKPPRCGPRSADGAHSGPLNRVACSTMYAFHSSLVTSHLDPRSGLAQRGLALLFASDDGIHSVSVDDLLEGAGDDAREDVGRQGVHFPAGITVLGDVRRGA